MSQTSLEPRRLHLDLLNWEERLSSPRNPESGHVMALLALKKVSGQLQEATG